jgi:hypothetical protein
MARLKGKEDCDPIFILQFLIARDKANETNETVPIKGYGGWHVSPSKDLKDE